MENQGLLHNASFVRVLIILAFLAIFLVVACVIAGETFYRYTTDIASLIAALIVTVLASQTYRDNRVNASRFVWLGMALGFGLWCIADGIWAFFSIVLNEEVPYPSVADLAWLVGYIPLALALFTHLKMLKLEPTRAQEHLLRTVSAAWLAVTFIFVILPIIATLDVARALEGFVSITYPLADIVLALLSLRVFVLMQRGRFALSWRLIFAGLLLMAFSDQVYSFATWQGIYYAESGLNLVTVLIDLTYILAYVLVALGVYVYRVTWQIKDTFTLSLDTMPSAHYYTFIGTNKENQIISLSDNFYYLVSAKPDTPFFHQSIQQALGITPSQMQELNDLIAEKDILIHHPYRISNTAHQPVAVWITAKAFYDTDKCFSGASFVFTAEIPVPEAGRLPRNQELASMMNYLISLAGSRPQDENQTIQTYFLEMIRMLASMLYHFGGPQFKDAFFDYLHQTIQQKNLPIKLSDQLITLSEEYEGGMLAAALFPVLEAASKYARDLLGEQAINAEIADLENQLSPTAIRDLDKYDLRAFHTTQAA